LKEPEARVKSSNDKIDVYLLFKTGGCSVYRFVDAGHYVYFTDCSGKTTSVYQQTTGKTSYEVRIENETIE
jgi:hypothetical protein